MQASYIFDKKTLPTFKTTIPNVLSDRKFP
jgi:hypothetical protein